MADAKKISIEYENGTVKELNKGIAYGMMVTVEKMGMTPLLLAYAEGGVLPDEN